MKTSADNRRIRSLVTALRNGELTPRPDFQRKLVWSNADKLAFLDTVLKGYPFPEIYIAVGEVDLVTAAGTEMLVDGQQRITTLHQYFSGSDAIKLNSDIRPYKDLSTDAQTDFLNYEVAVRNLGIIGAEEIQEVFRRINSTSYSLNAMEIHNARYRGPLKHLADELAQDEFFEKHRMFSTREVRRMRDVVYCLTILISMLSTYFNRDDDLEDFLERYNDELPEESELRDRFQTTRDFIEQCRFPPKSRAWKKTDLLVLIVELDRLLNKEGTLLDPARVSSAIEDFYKAVEKELSDPSGDDDLQAYIRTTVQATNDRSSRVNRGRVLRKVVLSTLD